jgi:two-component system NtrC family response regulator
MMFTQKMKLSSLKPFQERLLNEQESSSGLINLLQDLKIKIYLPGIDETELNLSFSDNTLKISKKIAVEGETLQSGLGGIVAESARTKVALGIVARMAKTDDTVTVFGEHGTGKGLFARTIHQQSSRSGQPFVCLSCGSIGKNGAKKQIIDSFVDVGTGTLFLDDIQDLDIDTQRMLQKIIRNPVEQKYFRLITGTNANLDKLVRKGTFSVELLALLRGCYIELLPLRERKEDIGLLVTYYIEQLCQSKGMEAKLLSPELLRILETYHWPGNVLELVNTVEQLLMTVQEKKTLFAKDLPAHIRIQTLTSLAAQKKGL